MKNKINVNIKIYFFIVLLLSVFVLLNATEIYAADTSIVSRIVKKFNENLSNYEKIMLKYAKLLFYWCAVLEVAFIGIRASLGASDIGETIRNFCMSLLAAGFFLAVINNYHEWTWNILNGLKAVAGEATTLMDAADEPFTIGYNIAKTIFDKSGLSQPFKSIGYIFAGFAIMFCFALITLQIVLIKCECLVAICAAAILLGLGATSFFRDYAVNTIKYVVSVAFKLMTMNLLMGLGMSFFQELKITDDWSEIGVAICFCAVYYCLVKQLPETIGGIITGSHIGGGNTFSSTMRSMGAAALGLAAGAAGGAYAGAKNVGLAAQAAKAEGASGVTGMAGGIARNLWNGSREAAMNRSDRQNTVSSALRQRIEDMTRKQIAGKQ